MDIVVARASGKITADQEAVLRKMGLTDTNEATAFEGEQKRNPAMAEFFGKYEHAFATDPKYDKMLKAFGDRLKTELAPAVGNANVNPTTIMDTLNKELTAQNGPQRKQKMAEVLANSPDKLASAIPTYREGALDTILGIAPTPSAPSPAGVAAPVSKPAAPAKEAAHAPATKPASAPPPSPVAAAAEPKGDASVLSMVKDLKESISKSFPELENDAKAFYDKIEGDKALQTRIGHQLSKNPDLVAQLSDMKSDKPLSDGVKKSFRPFVQNMLHNPEDLGTDEGMQKTISGFNKAKTGATVAGVGDWLKKNLGLDVSGAMGGMGAFFDKIGNFFKNLVGQFTNGNFMNMRNSGMGLGGAFMAAMDNASAMSRYGPEDVKARPVLGADGKAFHKEKYYELDEQKNRVEKEREVPNTITVTSINGTEHKVIPATGLSTVQDKQGNWHVAVATDINKNGSTKSMTADLVLSPVEYEKYKREAKLTAQDLGEIPYQQRMVTEINPKTGAASPAVEVQPAGMQQSGVETKPVSSGQANPVPLEKLETEEEKRRRMGITTISPSYSQA